MWSKIHAEILSAYFQELDKSGIKFFIIRNFEGLPEKNTSKDVDIILKHGTAFQAEDILKQVFKRYGMVYYYRMRIEETLQCRAVNEKLDMAIHIDLMNGYINRGTELFSFEELYSQTIEYNGFRVLNELYNGVMLFIYKQFGYKKPYLKDEYKRQIYDIWKRYPEFSSILKKMIGSELYSEISKCIEHRDFDWMLGYSSKVTTQLRRYANKKSLVKNTYRRGRFILQKALRTIVFYRHYEKSISVMAPDGTGKTTFLNSLLDRVGSFYVDAPHDLSRFHIYHFRPTLLSNLGAVGEKAGMMKQDTDFTNPHRAKPAGFIGSLLRLTYYWLDYVIGWMCFTRKDVQYDKYTIYDRYSYDLLVDPHRTRLGLPFWIRNIFVTCMPRPKLNFFLKADPSVVIKRKAELSLEEIERQVESYSALAKRNNLICIDANKSVDTMVEEALPYIINKYFIKL